MPWRELRWEPQAAIQENRQAVLNAACAANLEPDRRSGREVAEEMLAGREALRRLRIEGPNDARSHD